MSRAMFAHVALCVVREDVHSNTLGKGRLSPREITPNSLDPVALALPVREVRCDIS
jgi:hypothetical protein